jgi:cell division protein FtsN
MHRNQNEESIAEVDAKLRDINDNWKKYNKRLGSIYDNAEIEAEIEAEKKIRSKNSKLTVISTIGFILLIIIFFKVKQNTNEIQSLLGNDSIIKGKTTNLPENSSAVSPQKKLERINLPPNTNLKINKFNPNVTKPLTPKGLHIKSNKNIKISKLIPVLRPEIDSKIKYSIQMGVFSNKSNAVKYLTKLKSKGYKAETITRNANSHRYQVTFGSYNKKSEATKNITKLKSIGLSPSLKKYGPTYTLELGLFKNKVYSKKLINKLKNSGLKSNIKKIKTRNALYIVGINGFSSKLEAKKSHQHLISQGFKNSFIRPS